MDKKTPIYLYSSGDLRVENQMMYFQGIDEYKSIDPNDVDEIYVLGEIDFDKKLLKFASQSGIVIHLFNYYGYYSGSFYPQKHSNSSDVMIKQVEHYLDATQRMKIAMAFVDGAVKNMLQVIKYYNNRGKDLSIIEDNIKSLHEIIYSCTKINELMAIEGNIRNYYYEAFDIVLGNSDFLFERRSRRPPKNHLNTLISFGNSMLYTLILGQIYYTHLDPRIGYLHATNFRRYTLNLDIAEIFKPIIVDRVIFTVINRKMITSESFEKSSEGIMLKEKGREVFIEQFEDKLSSLIEHRGAGKNVSYKELIKMEIDNLERYLTIGEEYNPFTARW